jgi:hypothetical protein
VGGVDNPIHPASAALTLNGSYANI